MRVRRPGHTGDVPGEGDVRRAGVRSGGDGERQIEPAQLAERRVTLADGDALGVVDDVVHGAAGDDVQPLVAGGREPADEALHRHRLTGPVGVTVVDHVPAGIVGERVARPVALVEVVRQERDIRTRRGGHGSDRVRAEIDPRDTIVPGGGRGDRAITTDRCDLHASGRRACGQVGRPDAQLVVVGESVDAELGGLQPRHGRPVEPVAVVVLTVGLGRFDDRHEVAQVVAAERVGEVDAGLDALVRLVVDADLAVHARPPRRRRRLGAGLTLLGLDHVALERRPLIRRDGEQAQADLVVVHRGDHERWLAGQWVDRGEQRRELLEHRLRRPDGHLLRLRRTQRLAVDVGERGGQRHRVRRAGLRSPADLDDTAERGNRHSGEVGRHGDRGRIELRGVELVVELDLDGARRRAVAAAAAGLHDP